MDYSEADIEVVLMESKILSDEGYMPLWNQVRTSCGIIDILALNTNNNNLTVIELKKGLVDENAVGQIMRYIAVMKDYLRHQIKEHVDDELWQGIKGVEGLLIGSNCTSGVDQIVKEFSFLNFIHHHVTVDVALFSGPEVNNLDKIQKDAEWIKLNTDIYENLSIYLCPLSLQTFK